MRLVLVLLAILTACLTATTTNAQVDSNLSRPSLKGLKGVYVVVEDISMDATKDGIFRDTITTNTELLLRQNRIPILSEEDWKTQPTTGAMLYVKLSALKYPGRGLYMYAAHLEVRQWVTLPRGDKAKVVPAVTWFSTGKLGFVGDEKIRTMYEVLDDEVKQFANAYLSQNKTDK